VPAAVLDRAIDVILAGFSTPVALLRPAIESKP